MEKIFEIGQVLKPQGIRGELKIRPLTDDVSRFKLLKSVLIDDKTYQVQSVKYSPDSVFISLSGINDRDTAETFRGKFLFVTRENAVPLPEGRYFIVDLIGCEVKTDLGELVGKVTDITSSRTDIFTVATVDNRIMRFPFLKDLVNSIDVNEKTVIVKRKRLLEVSCYED